MRNLKWPWDGKIGVAIALLLALNAAAWFAPTLFEPVPYKDVELVSLTQNSGSINVVANFVKVGCTFDRLVAVGFAGGESDILKWKDGDNLPENYDREAGLQTINIEVRTQGIYYDWIEIRTRHYCNSRHDPIDLVFLRLDNLSPRHEVPEGHFNDSKQK